MSESQPWWKDEGFVDAPRYVLADGTEIVYRVGGGPINLALGRFFSPLKASCVSEAELRANVVQWGNRCHYVATFRIKRGVGMWVGKVAHDSRDIADRAGEQILIDHPQFAVELVRDVEPLRQDLFVSPRASTDEDPRLIRQWRYGVGGHA